MKLNATDAVALVELWAGIKHYVPAKEQRSAAAHYISNIDEAGLVDLSATGAEFYGICDVFDKALRDYLHENSISGDDDEYGEYDD
jgi:hypothetical protein